MNILILDILTDDCSVRRADRSLFPEVGGYAGMLRACAQRYESEYIDAGLSGQGELEAVLRKVSLRRYAGIIIGGSATSITAHDALQPWQTTVLSIIRCAWKLGIPTLGLCGGHQYGARALSEHPDAVQRNPLGRNMGSSPLWLTRLGKEHFIFRGITNRTSFQWSHMCIVNRSLKKHEDFSVLASHPMCWCAAFQSRSFIGLQCHPEVAVEQMRYGADFITRLASHRIPALQKEGFFAGKDGFVRFMREDVAPAPGSHLVVQNWVAHVEMVTKLSFWCKIRV